MDTFSINTISQYLADTLDLGNKSTNILIILLGVLFKYVDQLYVIAIIAIVIIYKRYGFEMFTTNIKIKIYAEYYRREITCYFKTHPESLIQTNQITIGEINDIHNTYFYASNCEFHIKELDISGKIFKYDETYADKKTNTVIVFELNKKSKIPSTSDIMEYIINENNKYTKEYMRKLICINTSESYIIKNAVMTRINEIYKETRDVWDKEKSKFLDNYFSPKYEYIKKQVKHFEKRIGSKQNKYRGYENKIAWLLHGPPGTGKSSLAYKLAIYFNRNIHSLNFKTVNNFNEFMDLISTIKLYDNKIILLDEFESTVKKFTYQLDNKFGTEEKMNEEASKEKFIVQSSFGIKDIVRFLQDHIPKHDAIIIATSNDIGFIRERCPELIRPGRLEPIEIGYMDQTSMDRLTMEYYGATAKMSINICTAKIIQLANTCETLEEFVEAVKASPAD